jgi:NhaA family Na+:H+ antiporter
MLLGVLLWLALLKSGVHATLAGVILAFTIPMKPKLDTQRFLQRAHRLLDEIAQAARAYDEERLLRALRALVPEFEVQTAVPAPAPARVIALESGRPRSEA